MVLPLKISFASHSICHVLRDETLDAILYTPKRRLKVVSDRLGPSLGAFGIDSAVSITCLSPPGLSFAVIHLFQHL